MKKESLSLHIKTFDQPKELQKKRYNKINDDYETAKNNRLKFWDQQAEKLHWHSKWKQTLDWQRPYAKWFVGGKLNASENCLRMVIMF
tara:strand:- start:16 stop:279 length:264 start_codon:yes stop_codon:yes gene_type:complete